MTWECRSVLVPLDGSESAEAVLPAGAGLAARFGALLTLLHVVERDAPKRVHGEPHLRDAAAARAYLDGVAQRVRGRGVEVRIHVHEEPTAGVADAVLAHAYELGADLIALCTHGATGVRHRLLGSIAQQVLQRGAIPVLLVSPSASGGAPSFGCERVLVALDPVAHGTGPLRVARAVVRVCGGELHLVTVIPTPGTLPLERGAAAAVAPLASRAVLDLEERDVMALLTRRAEPLRAEGIMVSVEARRGDPVAEVLRAYRDLDGDLLVLATHGRGGIGGWLAGSFTLRVLLRLTTPALLVPEGRESGIVPGG